MKTQHSASAFAYSGVFPILDSEFDVEMEAAVNDLPFIDQESGVIRHDAVYYDEEEVEAIIR